MAEPTAKEMVIRTHRLRLTAKQWGAEDGMPMVGLHGWLDNANTFDRLAPLLRKVNLVSLDLPGHGQSDHRPDDMRYHYTDYVDDVMDAADHLGWERFILLGHSMGAGIGCLAASAYPERVSQLILIEGLGAVTDQGTDVPAQLRQSADALKKHPYRNPAPSHDLDVLIRARAFVGRIKWESSETLVRRSVVRNGEGYRWRSDPRLTHPSPVYFTNDVMLAFLRGIRAPVLLITAEDGTLRRRPYFASRLAAVENLKEITLAGHHHLHLDTPLPVAEVINQYLRTDEDPIHET